MSDVPAVMAGRDTRLYDVVQCCPFREDSGFQDWFLGPTCRTVN